MQQANEELCRGEWSILGYWKTEHYGYQKKHRFYGKIHIFDHEAAIPALSFSLQIKHIGKSTEANVKANLCSRHRLAN